MTRIAGLVSAVPDAALAGLFLVSWVNPFFWGEGTVRYLLMLMLLEFVTIHSSAFLGVVMFSGLRGFRVPAIVGLGLFYSLFIWAISAGFGSPRWPLAAFWILIANRLLNVLLGDKIEGKVPAAVAEGWAVSVAAYLFSIFATILLPLPRLGLTPAAVARVNLPGEGLWIDEPQRVVAAGMIYFAVQACWDLFSARSES